MEEVKVKGVLEWPIPKCIKDMQKFLRLANYYCRFIEGFASVARPLHDMVKKDKKWDWMERQEKAFRELKERFTKKTGVGSTRYRQNNEDGGGCIRLCNGRSFINGV